MRSIICVVLLMATIEGFTKGEDWERFNSSLLIEVTRPNGVFTCTGVAVSSTMLLTAAHCLEGDIERVRVFTQAKYDPKQTSLDIKSYKLHPEYDSDKSRYHADLAKVLMKEKLPAFIHIWPIAKKEKVEGELYRFGFGERNDKNLRTVVTPTFKRINEEEEVVELNDKFSRSGDSGGPIFMLKGQEIKVLAIHSTFSHGPEGEYSLNPLLGPYLPWIFEH